LLESSERDGDNIMRKPLAVTVLLVTGLLLLGFASVSEAQLVLYDDFNSKPINPAKWSGFESDFGPAAPNTETARKIANGKLNLVLTSYGRTDSDTGTLGNALVSLEINNPTVVTTIQVDVTVKSAKVRGCAFNTTATRAAARVMGDFFSDGTSPGPGDRTGDIIAGTVSQRDSLAGDQIVAFVTSTLLCFFLVLTGNDKVVAVLDGLAPTLSLGTLLYESISVIPHYDGFVRGVVEFHSVLYFFAMSAVFLWATSLVLKLNRT